MALRCERRDAVGRVRACCTCIGELERFGTDCMEKYCWR